MITTIFIVAGILLFLVLSKLIEKPLCAGYCERLLSDPSNHNSALPAKLSSSVISRRRIFRSVSLPIPGKDGEEIQLGTVIVSRAGIFILCQINGSGIVENNPQGRWKHIAGGKFTEFENPFMLQRDARALIEYYAAIYGQNDIKAHSIIIYTNPSLRFTHQKPRGIMTASEFPAKLASMEKSGRLSREQVRCACKMLSEVENY